MMDATLQSVESKEMQDPRLQAARAFIEDVKKLDKGQLAVLRRNAGKTFAEARGVAWFYRLLGRHARGWDEHIFFLVATLLASDKRAIEDTTFPGNFGATMMRLKSKGNPESIERRFGILLDAEFDPDGGGEMAFRLRQAVKLAISKGVSVDWPQLLVDLRSWGHERKWVQKKWAANFYTLSKEADAPPQVDPLTEAM